MKKCLISKYGDVVWCPNWLKNLEWYLMSSWIFHWRFWKSKIWISVNSGLDGFDTCFLDIYLMGRFKKILCNFQSVNCEKSALFPVHLILKSHALFFYEWNPSHDRSVIEKFCGEVSIMEQLKMFPSLWKILSFFFNFIYFWYIKMCYKSYHFIWDIWWFHRSNNFVLWMPKSSPNLNSCSIKISHRGTSL